MVDNKILNKLKYLDTYKLSDQEKIILIKNFYKLSNINFSDYIKINK